MWACAWCLLGRGRMVFARGEGAFARESEGLGGRGHGVC